MREHGSTYLQWERPDFPEMLPKRQQIYLVTVSQEGMKARAIVELWWSWTMALYWPSREALLSSIVGSVMDSYGTSRIGNVPVVSCVIGVPGRRKRQQCDVTAV
jgi:hypothetical protein